MFRKILISIILALTMVTGFCVPSFAAEAIDKSLDEALLKDTLEYIKQAVPQPSYGVVSGEWSVFDLALANSGDDAWYSIYLDSISKVLEETNGILHERKYTEYSRVVMAITALGFDASNFNGYNIAGHLADRDSDGNYLASWQGRNGTAYALIALDSANYLDDEEGRAARANFIDTLATSQRENGSWSISDTVDYSDIDVTAIIVQALAPYYLDESKMTYVGCKEGHDKVVLAVDKALKFFSENTEDYFGSVEAATQVVIALSALGRDAMNDEVVGNAFSSILMYSLGDGKWTHLCERTGAATAGELNQMAVEQSAYALIAYSTYKEGRGLFDQKETVSYEFKHEDAALNQNNYETNDPRNMLLGMDTRSIIILIAVLVVLVMAFEFAKRKDDYGDRYDKY